MRVSRVESLGADADVVSLLNISDRLIRQSVESNSRINVLHNQLARLHRDSKHLIDYCKQLIETTRPHQSQMMV